MRTKTAVVATTKPTIGSSGSWASGVRASGQVEDSLLFGGRLLHQAVELEDVHLAHGASALLEQPLVDAALVEL